MRLGADRQGTVFEQHRKDAIRSCGTFSVQDVQQGAELARRDGVQLAQCSDISSWTGARRMNGKSVPAGALWGRLVFLTPTACSAFAFLGIIQERCGHRQFVSAWMTNIFHPACTNMTTLIEPSKYDELLKTTGEQNKTISLELRKGMEAFTSKLKEKDSMINSLALRVNESIGALAQH
ncbi:Hypothetical predicted protein [Cloeon dipterum]|uniref:Uncharacterized protein n=1 Tax=Cloeon dipterum TaxID=197152 RepID=A0A8S1DUL1_9INSE|nr:Hypothetical predicted protein [Cloeon dipterum]